MAGKDASGGTARSRAGHRRSPRLPVDLAGTLTGRSRRDVQVLDLSLTGCLVRGDASYNRGAILDLTLQLGPDPVGGKVRVTESYLDGASSPRRYLCGLEFLSLPPREETRLRRFLDEERRRRRAEDTTAR